ncbi:hypothetical protein T484DRAFT_1798141 [Baffinella frigidus]|nr:hypothetical protein T484DRAFT_1798141 [Cryptophyta sp. CCMP2293]
MTLTARANALYASTYGSTLPRPEDQYKVAYQRHPAREVKKVDGGEEDEPIDSIVPRFATAWSRTYKAAGMVISNTGKASIASSNPLPFTGGFAAVRSEHPLPSIHDMSNLFVEFILRRPGAHDGSSLQGPYTIGLQTAFAQPRPQLVAAPADMAARARGESLGATKSLREMAAEESEAKDGADSGEESGAMVKDKEQGQWWGVSVSKPVDYMSGWSMRYRASRIQLVEGPRTSVATLSEPLAEVCIPPAT